MRHKIFSVIVVALLVLSVANSNAKSIEIQTERTTVDSRSSFDSGENVGNNRVPRRHGIPESFAVSMNYPNPFNATTSVDLDLPSDAVVWIVIYNIMGQKVRTLENDILLPGRYSLAWDGRNDAGDTVSSGVYFYVLVADNNYAIRKMMLLK